MLVLRQIFYLTGFCILLSAQLYDTAYAQSSASSPYIPSLIPPSPNAAALMKFTDVPVSPYTGTTDITVPIYTIKAKGINLPISVSYHTGGIKLEEEASSVGLGWALNAGGMISRTIMGHDDFGTQGYLYLTNECPQVSGDITGNQVYNPGGSASDPWFFDMFCSYVVNTSSGSEDLSPAFQSGSDNYDMEPDIFSYNFEGHSGKFILTRSGQVVMQKQENIRIQFQGSGSEVTFTITDDQGNVFYFNVLESVGLSPYPGMISSWLLSKIVTQQQDSLVFNYMTGGSTTSTAPEYYETYTNYCADVNGFFTTNGNNSVYYNQTIQSIDFSNGHIQFAFDANRSDLQGGYKLDSVMVYSKDKLGNEKPVKQDDFYYSYFNSIYGSFAGPVEYYRLKLDSVKEIGGGVTLPPYSFVYNNPEPGLGSAKHSFNVDHWGYFNGADNSVLIPTMSVAYNPPGNQIGEQTLQYTGADRSPDFQHMQTFSLQQVTYPTGGRTVFNYQANDYDYTNSIRGGAPFFQYVQIIQAPTIQVDVFKHGLASGTIDLSNVYPQIVSGQAGTNIYLSVAFRFDANGTNQLANSSGMLYFEMAGYDFDINTATYQGGPIYSTVSNIGIAPGIYHWDAYIDPSVDTATVFEGIYVAIAYKETEQVYNLDENNSYAYPASGLRVQSITNYKDPTTIASKKVYTYNYQADKNGTGNPQQYSYGRLMSIPSYVRYGYDKSSSGNCTSMSLFSSSLTSLTSSIQGNIVGYDQVTETTVDPNTGKDIGQTIYKYFNYSDTPIRYDGFGIPGVLNLGNNLNGLLLSKADYSDNAGVYNKVSETDYYYHTANRSIYYSPKYQFVNGGAMAGGSACSPGTNVETETLAWFYPSLKSERVLLDATVTSYYPQDNSTVLSKNVTNFYDNPAHYQVTRSKTTDSRGNTDVSFFKYPQDYVPTESTSTGNIVLDSMISRNMVSETIEKQDSLYIPGSSQGGVNGGQLTLYGLLPANPKIIMPEKIYRLDVPAPIQNFQPFSINGNLTSQDSRYEQKVAFNYDGSSDILQYTAEDQIPTSFIWDYLNIYPIAKVSNAQQGDIAYTSFEADGTGNWSFSGGSIDPSQAITGHNSYQNGTITRSGLNPATTYMVSYWSQNGAYNIPGTISGYPQQGKTINYHTPAWTLYIHKVTGQSTITVNATGHIDELRLYPATAQMTTYTYDPLVGMTTQMDAGSRATYYEYDGLQRLKRVRDQDYNILKTIDYAYQVPAGCGSGCYTVAMQTFAGTNTLSYPVGVFDVNGKLLGNAANAAGYVSLWNGDTADARVGTLGAGADSLHFNLTVNAGQTLLPGVTGCRYYQYDLPDTELNAVTIANGAYVDFGDGIGMIIPSDTVGVHLPANTLIKTGNGETWIVHDYIDFSRKTITFYHNDASTEAATIQPLTPYVSTENKVANLRGNVPQFTQTLNYLEYQQGSALTFSSVNNWRSINTVTTFRLASEGNIGSCLNVNFQQDFMASNNNLQEIDFYDQFINVWSPGYIDSSFKISTLKSDWNTYFINLRSLSLSDYNWNRENLNALTNLKAFVLVADNHQHNNNVNNNPAIPLPDSVIDNVLMQIAAGSGRVNSNGTILITTGGSTRTAASDAAYNLLISKGWFIYIDTQVFN